MRQKKMITMCSNPNRGRVYRRCACRDDNGQQLGTHCPKLGHSKHGTWTFAVDMPSLDGRRKTMRRGGFATKAEAQLALNKVLDCERTGVVIDDQQTVADYLEDWLQRKVLGLKPTTMASYHRYVRQDLVPALGAIKLEKLRPQHVDQFVRDQLNAGRGPTTLRRCVATLSSALSDAVQQRRLSDNAAKYAAIPIPPKPERTCWTPGQAVRFLQYCAEIDDPLTHLYEVIIGTGLRKGEALALHWSDVYLDERVQFVRYTLSNIDNAKPVFTTTKTSLDWVGLSTRVVDALKHQALRRSAFANNDLVFTRTNGRPLRPEYVLNHLHELTEAIGLPRIRVHDLRHLAATLMIASGVPFAVVSKTMRHSTLSITVNIYGHLTRHAAHQAVDAMATTLNTTHDENLAA
jgi:integrase